MKTHLKLKTALACIKSQRKKNDEEIWLDPDQWAVVIEALEEALERLKTLDAERLKVN